MKIVPLIFLLSLLLPIFASCADRKEAYIVYFGVHKGDKTAHEIGEHHHSYLLSVKESEEEARSSLIYSYKHSINGFAALLTPDEASKLKELKEVISIYKSHPKKYVMQTTRSWNFVGVEDGIWGKDVNGTFSDLKIGEKVMRKARYGEGVIVGLVDSGVWPDSRSFSDEGMSPIPKSWKGICQTGPYFNSSHCNRKIIGARYFLDAYEKINGPLDPNLNVRSPLDVNGHGSHTASIVTGRRVRGVSYDGGLAYGTASGGAPLSHLAVYKACWEIPDITEPYCEEADIMAAIDQAIADGVHVISVSIGGADVPYSNDSIALGAIHAAKHNILLVAGAGNDGPKPGTAGNTAPWILTVGASTIDREFIGGLVLGNGYNLTLSSVTAYEMDGFRPLVYAEDVILPFVSSQIAPYCLPGALSPDLVQGKVVLCARGLGDALSKGMEVKRAGGAGMILGNTPKDGETYLLATQVLPAVQVGASEATAILDYIRYNMDATAFIKGAKTVLGSAAAPVMASFSSRGPNAVNPMFLKPDITAPGMQILASWTEASSRAKRVEYNMDSGTSMSTPHVAAAAVLLKAIHPDWSSSAIKSAIMTTASTLNDEDKPITEESGELATPFAFGSGHFRPSKALDPGLVYDTSYEDYLLYLCTLGESVDDQYHCPINLPSPFDLNYPSISLPRLNGEITIKRTVTNVDRRNKPSIYSFSTQEPQGFSVYVNPPTLVFDRKGQKRSFTITVRVKEEMMNYIPKDQYFFGWYAWSDGNHLVKSPIAVSLV